MQMYLQTILQIHKFLRLEQIKKVEKKIFPANYTEATYMYIPTDPILQYPYPGKTNTWCQVFWADVRRNFSSVNNSI